jgi:hypothetical protein
MCHLHDTSGESSAHGVQPQRPNVPRLPDRLVYSGLEDYYYCSVEMKMSIELEKAEDATLAQPIPLDTVLAAARSDSYHEISNYIRRKVTVRFKLHTGEVRVSSELPHNSLGSKNV